AHQRDVGDPRQDQVGDIRDQRTTVSWRPGVTVWTGVGRVQGGAPAVPDPSSSGRPWGSLRGPREHSPARRGPESGTATRRYRCRGRGRRVETGPGAKTARGERRMQWAEGC